MGAGVFSSDFKGTGTTFLVSGSLEDPDAAYRVYLTESANEAGFVQVDDKWMTEAGDVIEGLDALADALNSLDVGVMSLDDVRQDLHDNEIGGILDSIYADVNTLGLSRGRRRGNRLEDDMQLDREFGAIGDDGLVEIGLRGWENDYVIGIAAGAEVKEALQDIEYHSPAVMNTFGMPPEHFKSLHISLVHSIEEYVRLGLLANGYECRFRTSGYTTQSYEKPNQKELKDQRKQLAKTIKDTLGVFKNGKFNLLTSDTLMRAEMMRELLRLHDEEGYGSEINYQTTIAIPFFNPETNEAVWYSPYFEGAVASAFLAPEVIAFMQDRRNGNDMIAIPRAEETEAWLTASQQHLLETRSAMRIVATAHEVVEAWKEDLVLRLPNDDEDIEEVVVMRSNRPAMRM